MFRFISFEQVIVEACLLFYNDRTLSGNKLLVYIVMKIWKKCSKAKVESYKIKFAVHNALAHVRYETEDIGTSMKRVKKFSTMRGMFKGVEETLARLGVKKIKAEDEGLFFVMEN